MANNTNTTPVPCAPVDLNVYQCSDLGLMLPLVSEYTWPIAGRAILYGLGMLWCFLGVAIIADVFMCSIEKITSKTRPIRIANPDTETGYEEIHVKVWNDTVANLTLMALGSSAPEILLNVIEVIGNKFASKADGLGASTIVGSAAFNLFVITAVCVYFIPSPEVRTIKYIKVFAITATFSVLAYVWLIVILVLNTPDYVDLWEAVLTFLFFPILVLLAYIADKDYCGKKKVETDMEIGFDATPIVTTTMLTERERLDIERGETIHEKMALADNPQMTESRMREFIKECVELKKLHPQLKEEEIAHLAAAKVAEEQQHGRLWYRINASRAITGGRKLIPALNDHMHEVYEDLKEGHDELAETQIGSTVDMSIGGSKAVIEFAATQSAILEREGRVRIGIRRYGKTNHRVLVKVETIDGTAEAQKDYVPVKTTIVFAEGDVYTHIDIEIIDDDEWEPDEVFFVKIALDPKDACYYNSVIGKKSIHEVTIVNDDEPGTFEFSKPSLLFKESCGKAQVPIERVNGADGKIDIKWKTEDMSARSGQDYEGGEGTLTFEHGETTKMLEIPIYDDQEAEKDECFKVELLEVNGGAKLGRIKKTIVTIVNDDDFNGMVSRLVDLTNMNMDALRVDTNTYSDQFRNALNVNGGDIENASHMDYVMHFLTFGWKILFAIVPPPHIAGGWITFWAALGMIGLLTAFVADLASIFGCLIGLDASVNAILFVALGTSLPDLFASKQAATQEKTADNSIGNVTGSNSVNVFLGLGMPWLLASIYWTAQGKTFYYKAGTLVFSVLIYCICAMLCITVLMIRRYVGPHKGELGGSKIPKLLTSLFFIFLWFVYVTLSALQAYGFIKGSF